MSLRIFCSLNPSSPAAEATTTTDPRYVYYRVFWDDGAVPTLHPATPDDPFLGRVLATSIAPPHNVDSIKRGLAKHEDINHRHNSILFRTRSSQWPMDNTRRINILKPTGKGSTPEDALALVVKLPDDIAEWGERPAFVNYDGPTGTRCLYYRLYNQGCELSSRVPLNPEQPSLGCIRVDWIAPPYTANSIIRCISRAECAPQLIHSDLFTNLSSHTPIRILKHFSILTGYIPGPTQDEPMALVANISDLQHASASAATGPGALNAHAFLLDGTG